MQAEWQTGGEAKPSPTAAVNGLGDRSKTNLIKGSCEPVLVHNRKLIQIQSHDATPCP